MARPTGPHLLRLSTTTNYSREQRPPLPPPTSSSSSPAKPKSRFYSRSLIGLGENIFFLSYKYNSIYNITSFFSRVPNTTSTFNTTLHLLPFQHFFFHLQGTTTLSNNNTSSFYTYLSPPPLPTPPLPTPPLSTPIYHHLPFQLLPFQHLLFQHLPITTSLSNNTSPSNTSSFNAYLSPPPFPTATLPPPVP
ncbi:hypothetical protein Pmani_010931 [Petrolisthes manimaculis]|uniref:Uncharacterized protein n=1 Tax=Petrolisthes manimaculis TaxID=1843537 RepID=A0AAE1Q3F0_9EUCA|nr:hypothetical protein Pmani_010931 [Petrolisthes manimaculis]